MLRDRRCRQTHADMQRSNKNILMRVLHGRRGIVSSSAPEHVNVEEQRECIRNLGQPKLHVSFRVHQPTQKQVAGISAGGISSTSVDASRALVQQHILPGAVAELDHVLRSAAHETGDLLPPASLAAPPTQGPYGPGHRKERALTGARCAACENIFGNHPPPFADTRPGRRAL